MNPSDRSIFYQNTTYKAGYLSLCPLLPPTQFYSFFNCIPFFSLSLSLSETMRCFSEPVLKSFWCPSKRWAKTHGRCVVSLLCAKERALVHDKGEDEGAQAGGSVCRADTPVLSPLLFVSAHQYTHSNMCASAHLENWTMGASELKNSECFHIIKLRVSDKSHLGHFAILLLRYFLTQLPMVLLKCFTHSSQLSKLRCPVAL